MKLWKIILTGALLCTSVNVAVLANDSNTAITDPSVAITNLDDYYITKGSVYNKLTGLIENLSPSFTGLNQYNRPYYFRIDQGLIDDYFYHVRTYNTNTHELIGDYLVASDNSCAWRTNVEKEALLIYGSTDKLMQRAEAKVYPEKIMAGGYGVIRLHVPGVLPYDIKVRSLNESVAKISDQLQVIPISSGKTDILIDLKVGTSVRSFSQRVTVVDRTYESDGSDGRSRPHVGIGIGIGWGGWHHHGGGGIGISIGNWYDDVY